MEVYMAFCSNCGKELKESYKFCPKCGKEIENISGVKDDLYEEVFKYVVENEKVSTSMIQNKFNISYNKATNMINMLEERGVVGPSNGNKGRVVLINKVKNEDNSNDNNLDDKFKKGIENIMDTPDTTDFYDKNDIKSNTLLAILSYLGLLAFIPYFAPNESKFVKYHATQGMNLLIMWGVYTLLDSLLGLIKVSEVVVNIGNMVGRRYVTPLWISLPMGLLGFILFVLSVTGIVYVCQGKAKELPLVGKIKIVK